MALKNKQNASDMWMSDTVGFVWTEPFSCQYFVLTCLEISNVKKCYVFYVFQELCSCLD